MAKPLVLFAGLCIIEDEALTLETASELKRQLNGLPVEFCFKASFDKANRTSIEGFRGPGLKKGLEILEKVKAKTGLPLLIDFHLPDQAEAVSAVADVLQIPAFLCRQTDMIQAAVKACVQKKCKLNIKKGQFLAPWDAKNIVEKASGFALEHGLSNPINDWLYITERGVSFGYNNLVVDMSSFQCMHNFGVNVIYDATHSVQVPGAAPGGKSTGGKREYLETLARAAVAAGADGIFMECHPTPEKAKSDGLNAFYLDKVGMFVKQLLELRSVSVRLPKLLPEAIVSRGTA